MAKVLFIFSSPAYRFEETFEKTMEISKLKQYLLKDNWPVNQLEKSKVTSVRFFCMGKELYNHMALNELNMPESNQPIPILVHATDAPVGKNSTTSSREEDSCCSCVVL